MNDKKEKGQAGEEYAIAYLQEKGYKLIERNFTVHRSEIDLIVQKDDLLVFVEVKLKANNDYGYPEEAVSQNQMNAIKRGAEEYLLTRPWPDEVRFDVIAITEHPVFEIFHFEDAFY